MPVGVRAAKITSETNAASSGLGPALKGETKGELELTFSEALAAGSGVRAAFPANTAVPAAKAERPCGANVMGLKITRFFPNLLEKTKKSLSF